MSNKEREPLQEDLVSGEISKEEIVWKDVFLIAWEKINEEESQNHKFEWSSADVPLFPETNQIISIKINYFKNLFDSPLSEMSI